MKDNLWIKNLRLKKKKRRKLNNKNLKIWVTNNLIIYYA